MKGFKILPLLLLCFMFINSRKLSAQVSGPVTAEGHITAEVIPVFSASETAQMNFGRFAPGPQGGLIVLTPESTVSVLGSIFTGQGTHNAASFYISGDVDASYSISLPKNPVVLTHIANARTMILEDWKSSPSPGPGAGRLQNGFQIVNVGATLKVGTLNDNPVGIYTGVYSITFDFN